MPPSIPPDEDWVCCGGIWVCCCWGGLVVVVELLGGGDLELPLDPPLAIFYDYYK
jgi:hypothetical protein